MVLLTLIVECQHPQLTEWPDLESWDKYMKNAYHRGMYSGIEGLSIVEGSEKFIKKTLHKTEFELDFLFEPTNPLDLIFQRVYKYDYLVARIEYNMRDSELKWRFKLKR